MSRTPKSPAPNSLSLKTLVLGLAFLAPAQALACAMYMPEEQAPLVAMIAEIDEVVELVAAKVEPTGEASLEAAGEALVPAPTVDLPSPAVLAAQANQAKMLADLSRLTAALGGTQAVNADSPPTAMAPSPDADEALTIVEPARADGALYPET